ncbi:MAG: hypothetical protein H6822_05135 [Planctomycetaceae bacterium]|nr:hypothetical protein [Planctomycetales bacterium]MCB9921540.1 hypothetical protein [Planctomycetaceae bacterium]
MKEIYHLLAVDNIEEHDTGKQRSSAVAITWIVIMNLVFSFDSILSALAQSRSVWPSSATTDQTQQGLVAKPASSEENSPTSGRNASSPVVMRDHRSRRRG